LPEIKALFILGFQKMFLIAEFSGDDQKDILKSMSSLENELKTLKSKDKLKIYTEIVKTKTEEEKF
jgi:hypothetical protein